MQHHQSKQYVDQIRDLCAAAGISDFAQEVVGANMSSAALADAIQQTAGASDRRAALRERLGISGQQAPTPTAGQAAGRSADPGVAAIDARVAEKQAARQQTAPAGKAADSGASVVDQVIAEKGAS